MTSPPRSLGYALTRRINIMGYLQNLIKKIETVEKQMHTEMYLHSPVAIEVLKNRCIEAISKIKDIKFLVVNVIILNLNKLFIKLLPNQLYIK